MATATVALVVGANVSSAALPAPEPAGSVPTAQQAQQPLIDAAILVRDAAEKAAGYSSIAIEDGDVVLRWRGGEEALPDDVRTVVAEASEFADVRVDSAEYDERQLLDASAELEQSMEDRDDFRGISAEPDGSGLTMQFDETTTVTGTFGARTNLDASLPEVGVPTSVEIAEAPEKLSRHVDSSPWSGGASIQIREGNVTSSCTAGFGVDLPSGPAIWTAAHCLDEGVGQEAVNTEGEPIGNVVEWDIDVDIALLSTDEVSSSMYVGDKESTTLATVSDGRAPIIGELLCQSGVTSADVTGGPVCGPEVTQQRTDSTREWSAVPVESGTEVARGGDSGGPVYCEDPDGSVVAVGSTTAAGDDLFVFTGFDSAEEMFDATIVTGDMDESPEEETPARTPSFAGR